MIFKRYFSLYTTSFNKNSLPTKPILPRGTKNTTSIAGNGGDGIVSFMRLKGNEFAGPDGGDGGNGAHIIFKADHNLKSLNKVQSLYQAENGVPGRSCHMKGKNGEHLIINVPVGTLLKNEKMELVKDLSENEMMYLAARGGAGGKGNYYYLSNDNKKPIQFELGHKGEEITLHLELKLIADAALIGYPNVGKSSLLNSLTRARAKVGEYSFTTLHPHVGVVEYEDFFQISIADLPGLLPDLTRGFGTRYLNHLDRCKIIVLVIDLSMEDPLMQFKKMKDALNFFDPKILRDKPTLVVGNKMDEAGAEENLKKFREHVDFPVVPVSAQSKINLTKFLRVLRDIYEKHNNSQNKKQ